MEQIRSQFIPIDINGFIETRLPSEILKSFQTQVKDIISKKVRANKANNKLAGFIEHQYELSPSTNFQKFINIIATHYVTIMETKNINASVNLSQNVDCKSSLITSMWVNFQKKYEVNPIHNHSGDLSFVTWLNIPYNLENELELPNVKYSSVRHKSANFSFLFGDYKIPGGVSVFNYSVDKNSVGKLILFNSNLSHVVYPFYTSDDYRISISGNINLEDYE